MMFARPVVLLSLAALLFSGGCASDKHAMTAPQPGQVSVCTKCYDQIQKVRGSYSPRHGYSGARTITTHMCEDCKNEMTIYEKDGVMKVRCPMCAPEGVDCDRCVPKESAK